MRQPRMASKPVKLQSPREGHRVQSLFNRQKTWPPPMRFIETSHPPLVPGIGETVYARALNRVRIQQSSGHIAPRRTF